MSCFRSVFELEFKLHPIFKPPGHLLPDLVPGIFLGQLLLALPPLQRYPGVVKQQDEDLPAVALELPKLLYLFDLLPPDLVQLVEVLMHKGLAVVEDVVELRLCLIERTVMTNLRQGDRLDGGAKADLRYDIHGDLFVALVGIFHFYFS